MFFMQCFLLKTENGENGQASFSFIFVVVVMDIIEKSLTLEVVYTTKMIKKTFIIAIPVREININ